MELKIEFGKGEAPQMVDAALRQTIMAGAVNHLLAELTPERLELFITSILDKSLAEVINGYEMRRMMEKEVAPIFAALLANAVTKAAIDKAVQEGVAKGIEQLPDLVAAQVKARMGSLFKS